MYGLTSSDIHFAKAKVEKNKSYMISHGIQVDGAFIPFSNFVNNSYMNSNRYIAEISNRVHSLTDYASSRSLVNVFFTLTLPSVWHPTRTIRNGKRVSNPRFGGRNFLCILKNPINKQKIKIYNTYENKNKYIVKNASKQLSKQLKKLFDDRFYKSIYKDDRVYFRVTEPHMDGTPHLHVSFFVPSNLALKFSAVLRRIYPEPLGKVVEDVKNPVAYLMKYVLKTLDDLRGDKKITALSLWYIHHGIARIYTSRTLINLKVYRLLAGRYSMIELTNMYRDNHLSIIIEKSTKKIIQIFDQNGPIYNKSSYTIVSPFEINKTYDPIPKAWINSSANYVPLHIDDQIFYYHPKYGIKQRGKPISSFSDLDLYNYYMSLDVETTNLHHFGYVKNNLIERGYIKDQILPLSSYYNFLF